MNTRARRVAQHHVRHAVADAPPRALRAAVPDHDRVGELLGRHVADPLGRLAALHAGPGRDVGEPLRDPRRGTPGVGRAIGVDHRAEVDSGCDVQDQELGAAVAGQSGGVLARQDRPRPRCPFPPGWCSSRASFVRPIRTYARPSARRPGRHHGSAGVPAPPGFRKFRRGTDGSTPFRRVSRRSQNPTMAMNTTIEHVPGARR